jgi:D-alanine-D-alanine ligase
MLQTKVLVLFGGESSEHEVSIASAKNVLEAIDGNVYETLLGFIDKTGKWFLISSFDEIDTLEESQELVPVLGSGSFMTIPETKLITPDVIFPILHGEHGEDGTIQGLADLLHIPIVGAGVSASVLAIDKDVCKRILLQAGIPVVPYIVHLKGSTVDFETVSNQLGTSLFIKPASLGSSVGVSKATNQDELQKALDVAHTFDHKVLIEKALIVRELEIGVLGNVPGFQVSRVGEIKPDREFYSYESKYDPESQTKVVIPAELPDEVATKIQSLTKTAFESIEGKGIARIDFFLTEDSEIYLNEVNTLPGFTNISMYPKLWLDAGVEYSELIDKLIKFALEERG